MWPQPLYECYSKYFLQVLYRSIFFTTKTCFPLPGNRDCRNQRLILGVDCDCNSDSNSDFESNPYVGVTPSKLIILPQNHNDNDDLTADFIFPMEMWTITFIVSNWLFGTQVTV